jgi:pyridoxine 5-phosphate synthase
MNLFVGLDHLASLREAGGTRDPDPVIAGALAELGGAGGLSISVGREGNGVQERDLRLLRETTRTVLNVCLPPVDEWVKLALAVRPDLATLIPEGREGSGTERGLDVENRRGELSPIIQTLKSGRITVSVLVNPAPAQVKAAHRVGAEGVLLHTGRFCWAGDAESRTAEFDGLVSAARIGHKLGLAVHAAGGLGFQTAGHVVEVSEIEAVYVGHALIARAALVGMEAAVREFLRILGQAAGGR